MPDNDLEYTANFEDTFEGYKNLVVIGASLMFHSFGSSLEVPHPEATQKLRDITGINDLNVYGYGFSGLKMVDLDKQDENTIQKLEQAYQAFPNNDTLFIIDTGGNDITSMSPSRAYSEIKPEQLEKFQDDLDAVFDKVNERNGDVIVADLTFRSHRNPLDPASAENFITDFSGSGPYIENEFRPRQTEHQPQFLNIDNRSVVDKYNFIRNHWTALLHTDGVHLNASSYPVFRDFILERVAYLFTDDDMPDPVEVKFSEHSDLIIIDIGTIEKSEYNTRSATYHPLNFSAITNEKPVTTLLKTITGDDVGEFTLDTTITDLTEAKIGVSTNTILPEDENASYKNWEVYSKEIMETALYFNEGESVTIKLTGLEINSIYDIKFVGSTNESDGGNLNLKDVRSLNEDEISTTEAIPLTGNFTAETNYAGELELTATSSGGRGYLSGISLEYVGAVEFEEVIVGEASDAMVRYRSDTEVTEIFGLTDVNLHIGQRINNGNKLFNVGVMVFELPEEPTGKEIDEIKLQIFHNGRDNTSHINFDVDLIGIRYNSSNQVLVSDYADLGTLLQESIIATSTSLNATIETNNTGTTNMTNWIKGLYNNGAKAGDYVFIKLQFSEEPNNLNIINSYRISSGDTEDDEKKPQLLIEYSVKNYTVNFRDHDDTILKSEIVEHGSSASAPDDPSRVGYTFTGWLPAEFTNITDDLDITAQYTINQYTITFNSDGGSEVADIIQDFGTAVTAPDDPIKTGYTFNGWTPELPTTMPAKNNTHTAQWTANNYDITFNANGGTGDDYTQSITFGNSANLTVNTFTRTGYTFISWNTQENGEGDSYDDEAEFTMNTEGQTLYAQWEINQYLLTYIASDNGTIDGNSSQTINHGENGSEVIAIPNDGYSFLKWSDGLANNSRIDKNIVEDTTISAFFVKKKSNGSFTLPSGIGDGQTNATVLMNSSGSIGQVDNMGVNYLSYINSRASFSTLISSTNNLSDHIIVINNLDLLNNIINFTIKSETKTFQLSLGEKILVDLDNDGVKDIEIKFIDIYVNRSELTIKSILDSQIINPPSIKPGEINREEIIQEAIDSFEEKNYELSGRLAGKILLQVERHGQAWYLDPVSQARYYLGRPVDAFNIMRCFGLGVSELNYNLFKETSVPSRLAGRIIIRPEANGEAYYINPENLEMYYLGRPDDAFNIMNKLSLGILNSHLNQLTVGIIK